MRNREPPKRPSSTIPVASTLSCLEPRRTHPEVAARDGYEIVHATFSRLQPGFKAIDEHLSGINLPKIALCGVELRSPRPLSLKDFSAFNGSYVDVLKSWGLLLDAAVNPVARTNVAPVLFPPPEPSFYGFSYTVRSATPRKTFIVAGAGEFGDLSRNLTDIIRRGDTSQAAITEKTRYVTGVMGGKLRAMGANWPDVTTINFYAAHELSEALQASALV